MQLLHFLGDFCWLCYRTVVSFSTRWVSLKVHSWFGDVMCINRISSEEKPGQNLPKTNSHWSFPSDLSGTTSRSSMATVSVDRPYGGSVEGKSSRWSWSVLLESVYKLTAQSTPFLFCFCEPPHSLDENMERITVSLSCNVVYKYLRTYYTARYFS